MIEIRRRARLILAVVLAVAVVAVIAAVSLRWRADPSSSAVEVRLRHVHGLVRSPGERQLLVGAHSGLYVSDGGGLVARGPNRDLMALTVGRDRLYASGHPARGEGLPPQLGLFSSDDGGRSWGPAALSGSADFHALVVTPTEIVGSDTQTGNVMGSADGTSWQSRSGEDLDVMVPGALATGVLVGAHDGEVLRSGDGGRSWASVAGAPPATAMAWDGTAVFAAGPQGLWRSVDEGLTWTALGPAPEGTPTAMLVEADRTTVGTLDEEGRAALWEGGPGRWRQVHQDPPTTVLDQGHKR